MISREIPPDVACERFYILEGRADRVADVVMEPNIGAHAIGCEARAKCLLQDLPLGVPIHEEDHIAGLRAEGFGHREDRISAMEDDDASSETKESEGSNIALTFDDDGRRVIRRAKLPQDVEEDVEALLLVHAMVLDERAVKSFAARRSA